jgi:hypothetical protein
MGSNHEGNPSFVAGSNDDNNGYIKTMNIHNKNSTVIGSKKDGSGYLTTFSNSGNRTSFISSDKKGAGMIGLYDKDQKLQYTQKGEKTVVKQISDDKKKEK